MSGFFKLFIVFFRLFGLRIILVMLLLIEIGIGGLVWMIMLVVVGNKN